VLDSNDSVVIATGYGLDDLGVRARVLAGTRIFSSRLHSDRLWGPPRLLTNMYRGFLSLGVKLPEREADYSSRISADVKKTWIYASAPPYVFMA
jgi:hypothetical protein